MERAKLLPVQNPPMVTEGVENFTYSALHRWFDQIGPDYKRSDSYAVFQNFEDQPDYTVLLDENKSRMGVSVFFKSDNPANDEVRITARQIQGNKHNNFADIDIQPLPITTLAWQRNDSHQLELIKKFIEGRNLPNPQLRVAPIAMVRSIDSLNIPRAEMALQKIGRLIAKSAVIS